MRIIGFSKRWDKLDQREFTTFRFKRKDRDWQVGEKVQVVFKPRSKNRQILGTAEIVKKELRKMSEFLPANEAIEDGFYSTQDMRNWLSISYGDRWRKESMNRFTLRWI